jgi:hypothetical protein
MTLIEYAKQFLGLQETAGANRGPLVDKWKAMVSKALGLLPTPWCSCFVFAMLCEFNKLTKKDLAAKLGFDADTWFPESTHSWLDQAVKAGRITYSPTRGDVFLLLKPDGHGGFIPGQPHHAGLLDFPGCPAVGDSMDTVEGNTVPGHLDGALAREGNGAYARFRKVQRGEFVFISIPDDLKQRPEDTVGTSAPEPRPLEVVAPGGEEQAPPTPPAPAPSKA